MTQISRQPEHPRVRVVDSLWTFAAAVVVVGPFALPLLWRNPRFTRKTKVVGTFAVVVLTIALVWGAGALLQELNHRLEEMRSFQP